MVSRYIVLARTALCLKVPRLRKVRPESARVAVCFKCIKCCREAHALSGTQHFLQLQLCVGCNVALWFRPRARCGAAGRLERVSGFLGRPDFESEAPRTTAVTLPETHTTSWKFWPNCVSPSPGSSGGTGKFPGFCVGASFRCPRTQSSEIGTPTDFGNSRTTASGPREPPEGHVCRWWLANPPGQAPHNQQNARSLGPSPVATHGGKAAGARSYVEGRRLPQLCPIPLCLFSRTGPARHALRCMHAQSGT